MGFFKRKRTTESVGKDIGASIRRQKQKGKILRTLQKEDEEREKERKLNLQIKELKAKKPSFFKKVSRVASFVGSKVKAKPQKVKAKPPRRRRRTTKTKVVYVERTKRRTVRRRKPIRRRVKRRTAKPKPQSPIGLTIRDLV